MLPFVFILAVLFLAGCVAWPKQPPDFIHANSRDEAVRLAVAWYDPAAGRTWSTVGFTGSMRPVLNGGEIILLQDFTGATLKPGQIAVFFRSLEFPSVLHRIIEIKNGAAYISGDNSRWSDGWVPLAKISAVVVKIITFPQS